MLDKLTSIIINHLYVSQTTQIKTNSIQVIFNRDNISSASDQISLQDSEIKFPSFCDFLGISSCNNRILTQKVCVIFLKLVFKKRYFVSTLYKKSSSMVMALTGNNGDNETNIGASNSISYSIYDENINEIPVNNLNEKIEFWIALDTSLTKPSYKYINAINASQNQNDSLSQAGNLTSYLNGFLLSGFVLNGQNVSISIQIKPENSTNLSIGYLILLKFGDNPIFNSTNNNNYDKMSILCPQYDLIENYDESFYLIFANMSRVNSFKVFVCIIFIISKSYIKKIKCLSIFFRVMLEFQ